MKFTLEKKIASILIVIFISFIFILETNKKRQENNEITVLAQTIKNAIWNFDSKSPLEYLNVSLKLYNYESIAVYTFPEDSLFLKINAKNESSICTFLFNIGLIRKINLKADIIHNKTKIAILRAVHIHDTIYTYFLWIIISILIWISSKFFILNINAKKHLEIRVKKRTEDFVRSEKKFRTLFEKSAQAILIIEDYIYVDCNTAALKLLGLSNKKEVIGLPPSKLSPKFQEDNIESKEKAKSLFSKTLKHGSSSFEWNHSKLNGEIFPVQVVLTAIPSKAKDIFHVVWTDIADRKKAEKDLIKLQNYLENIINSMPSILIGVDTNCVITQWNKTAESSTGTSSKHAIGKFLKDVMPSMSNEIQNIKDSISSKKTKKHRDKIYDKLSNIIHQDVIIYPLITNGVEGAVIRIDDITTRVLLEEKMVQNEKMLSVGGLAAGMAHEVNNPLAGMMQSADVMKNRLTNHTIPANIEIAKELNISLESITKFMEKRSIIKMLDTINSSGQRVADIVSNMLTFSRKSSVVSSNNIEELIDNTLILASTDFDLKKSYDFKSISIVKNIKDNLPMVVCESSKIQQVLLNLFKNGAEAMSEIKDLNSEFIISLYLESSSNLFVIEIKDNGSGIKQEVVNRVFEPFFTTKDIGEGTGLGLSVSYFIITENHGGKMFVNSTLGNGTTFTIKLPLLGKNSLG